MDLGCAEKVCLETAQLYGRRGCFELWIGWESGRPFSAMVADNRRGGLHLHFPADDVLPLFKPSSAHVE